MTETRIHPTAIVEPGAELGVGVEIGPYCLVGPRVSIGDRTRVHAHAQILNRVAMGQENEVFAGAIVGGTPQDRSFHGEDSEIEIGDRNLIREYVTIHLGTSKDERRTVIGSDNLLMAGAHIAHDCHLGDGITIANNVLLAGHVRVEDAANIAGGAGVHHWCTIGTRAMVGGLARVAMDVPPYLVVEGRPGRVRGLNLVGLRRAGLEPERLEAIREAYKILFHTSETQEAALQAIEAGEMMTPEVQHLLQSIRRSQQGYRGRYLEGLSKGHKPADADETNGDGDSQAF